MRGATDAPDRNSLSKNKLLFTTLHKHCKKYFSDTLVDMGFRMDDILAMNDEIVFPYKKAGVNTGFLAETEQDFVFKPCKYSAAVIRTETLKKNLRLMIKAKEARLIKAGTTEAVAVPRSRLYQLFK